MRHAIALGAWLLAAAAFPQEPPPAADDLQRAKALVTEKRYDEALVAVEAALAARPDLPGAVLVRAEIHRRSGRYDLARADYERLTTLRPEDSDAWFWLATLESWLHHDDASATAYARSLELSPCHADARKGRARLRRGNDLAGSEADLRKALECRPTDLEATELLADVLARAGKRAEAEALVNQAFTGENRERRLGDLALADKRYAEAAAHFQRALAEKPGDGSLHRRLGDAEREQGRLEPALAEYEKAVAADPADNSSQYWVGVLAYRLGRSSESGQAFDAILTSKPEDADALLGKARVLRSDGRPQEALLLVDRALASRPDSTEARLLRGALLASLGRPLEARREYGSVLLRHPQDQDANRALDRVGDERAIGAQARRSESELIEGLEDAGLISEDGSVIVPARLEYLNESVGGDLRYAFSDRVAGSVGVTVAREAVTDLIRDRVIYDFDVNTLSAGLDHRWGKPWRLTWRLGATNYTPREEGTLDEDTRFRASAQLEWLGTADQVTASYTRAPFIYRGFGASTLFRIFDHDRGTLAWSHELGKNLTLSASAGVSHYDDGSSPFSGSAALGWSKGDSSVILRYGHEPFPTRFLTDDTQELTFLDYDVVTINWDTPLAAGFLTNGEARLGLYGETAPQVVEDVDGDGRPDRTLGAPDTNQQQMLRAALLWSPPFFPPLRVGGRYYKDQYDFDTGDYNNREIEAVSLLVELEGDISGRFIYSVRYSHDLIDDERDSDYEGDFVEGRLEAKLGRIKANAGSVSLGVEGRYRENDLGGAAGLLTGERSEMFGVFVSLPF